MIFTLDRFITLLGIYNIESPASVNDNRDSKGGPFVSLDGEPVGCVVGRGGAVTLGLAALTNRSNSDLFSILVVRLVFLDDTSVKVRTWYPFTSVIAVFFFLVLSSSHFLRSFRSSNLVFLFTSDLSRLALYSMTQLIYNVTMHETPIGDERRRNVPLMSLFPNSTVAG